MRLNTIWMLTYDFCREAAGVIWSSQGVATGFREFRKQPDTPGSQVRFSPHPRPASGTSSYLNHSVVFLFAAPCEAAQLCFFPGQSLSFTRGTSCVLSHMTSSCDRILLRQLPYHISLGTLVHTQLFPLLWLSWPLVFSNNIPQSTLVSLFSWFHTYWVSQKLLRFWAVGVFVLGMAL